MPDKQLIEIPVVWVASVEVSGDPTQDTLITFTTEAEAYVVLRLPPTVVAELEAARRDPRSGGGGCSKDRPRADGVDPEATGELIAAKR